MSNIGILDPMGKNNNPLTNQPYSEEYKKLGKMWSNLPAYKLANSIIDDIKKHQVLLIVSSTGSGKTVLVPNFALHSLNYTGKIAITLPKQMATQKAAEFEAKILDVQLGKEIGYKFRGSAKNKRSDENKILYATDGTILEKLLHDPELKEFDIVIIDEAHERKIQIDFLLYLLKNALKLRPGLKVIIMSATIKSIFLDREISSKQFMDEGVKIITTLLKDKKNITTSNKEPTDIIFFVSSSREASTACKRISKYIQLNKNDYSHMTCKDGIYCVELYSGMNEDKKKLAQEKDLYKKLGDYCGKIIISTPVAESSLTIDGIGYVIDSGYELNGSYDAKLQARRLDKSLITHAQAKQRMGRTGRIAPGTCYHLYTKNIFENEMRKFPEPDIRTSNITSECLQLLTMSNIGSVTKLLEVLMQFIDPPKELYIADAVKTLTKLKLIDLDKDIITPLGIYVDKINADEPMDALAIIMGKYYQCSREIIKILSCISASKNNISTFFNDPSKLQNNKDRSHMEKLKDKYNKAQMFFKHKYGDHLTLLTIFEKYREKRSKYENNSKEIKEWCKKYFLKQKILEKSIKNYRMTKSSLHRVFGDEFDWTNVDILKNNDIKQMDIQYRIIACFAYSFRYKLAFQKHKNQYTTLNSDSMRVELSKDSFLHREKKLPEILFYQELFASMGNYNLNIASRIPNEIMSIIK
jgi:ATP-dependent RNA helicase DHX8/PRP22